MTKRLLALGALLSLAQPSIAQCYEAEHDQGLVGGFDFGYAVAVQGDYAVVGVPRWFGTNGPGAAAIYTRQGDGWVFDTTISGDNPFLGGAGPGDQFGFSVAIDGDRMVVGAPYEIDAGILNTGVVYVFRKEPTGWTKESRIPNPIPAIQDLFGWSVDLDGDRLMVGSPTLTSGPTQDVFIFKRSGTAWPIEQILAPPMDMYEAWFGRSVAIDGDKALVGVPSTISSFIPGYVAAYQHDGNQWLPVQKLVPGSSSVKDLFGRAMALQGDRVLVGGWNKSQAWIFHHDGTVWTEQAHFTGDAQSHFGYSVAIDGDHAVVGSPLADSSSVTGAVHLLRYDGGAWIEAGVLTAPDKAAGDEFGSSAALDSAQLLVGARHADQLGPDSGSAYSYRHFEASLNSAEASISLSSGGVQAMRLRGGEGHAGAVYAIVSSASGSCPGVLVDQIYVPVNVDGLTLFSIASANQAPYATSLGVLDAGGEASASFQLPTGSLPALAGLEIVHAAAVIDPSTVTVDSASNAIPLSLVP